MKKENLEQLKDVIGDKKGTEKIYLTLVHG